MSIVYKTDYHSTQYRELLSHTKETLEQDVCTVCSSVAFLIEIQAMWGNQSAFYHHLFFDISLVCPKTSLS